MEYVFYLGLIVSIFVHPYQIYVSAFISLLLIILNLMESYKDKKLISITLKPYNILMIIWFVWGLLSFFWIKSFGSWLNHILILFIALGYTITAPTLVRKKNLINNTKKILLFSYILVIIIGLFEVYTGVYFFTQNRGNIGIFSSLRYPVTFFYNPNDYAVFLVFGTILILFFDKIKINKISSGFFLSLILVATFYLLIVSQARLALFAAIIAIIIKMYFLIKSKKIRVILVILSLFLIFFLFKYYDTIVFANQYVISDYSGNIRVNLIKNALIYLSDSNFVGVGAGNLKYYLDHYSIYNTMQIFDVHNWWIEILVTYGVFIFTIYIYSYFNLIFRALNKLSSKTNMKFIFTWLILFIPLSVASSSAFQYIWIWIVNAIFYNEVYKEN